MEWSQKRLLKESRQSFSEESWERSYLGNSYLLASSRASRLACLRFQQMIKITLNCERPLIESKERKQTAGRKHQVCLSLPDQQQGVQHCADLTQNWPRNIQAQVRSSWTGLVTFSLMSLMIKQCFWWRHCYSAIQRLSRCWTQLGELFYYSWSTESFHTETKSEWSERPLLPN